MSEQANEAEEAKPIVAYKGFDADWTCRGFQYEVGKSYEHGGKVEACSSGFHACENPIHVLRYYRQGKFAIVEQSGQIARHEDDSKIASSRITVKAEIDLPRLIKAAIKYTMDRCTPAEGAHTTEDKRAVATSGVRKLATASGYYGAATASGKKSTACAPGRNGRARGAVGAALFLTRRDDDWNITHAWAGIVGQEGIKPDVFYMLDENGQPQEV